MDEQSKSVLDIIKEFLEKNPGYVLKKVVLIQDFQSDGTVTISFGSDEDERNRDTKQVAA